jgi:hypothetical protein
MNEALVAECKTFIEQGDLAGLQNYYSELQKTDFDLIPNWQFIYHHIYLHACLKKQKGIAEWLTDLFVTFDPVTQIALRQLFPYGRYLLAR